MKVAVTYEKETGNIFQHFGKTQYFKIYQIEDGKILSSEVIDNGGNGHHAIPPYLKSHGVETLILGNRGQGAIEAIAASGLKEMPGITGSADEAAELFAKGELKPNFEAKCNRHGGFLRFSTMPSFLLKNPAASSALQPFLRTIPPLQGLGD